MAPWTETDKYSFLLQILKQNDKAPNFSQISIPGRTEKAMRHQWTATRKEMAALAEDGTFAGGDDGAAVTTPKKRASAKAGGTPKKAKTAAKVKAEITEEEVEAEEEDFEDAKE